MKRTRWCAEGRPFAHRRIDRRCARIGTRDARTTSPWAPCTARAVAAFASASDGRAGRELHPSPKEEGCRRHAAPALPPVRTKYAAVGAWASRLRSRHDVTNAAALARIAAAKARGAWPTTAVAHRGSSAKCPECTLVSYEAAIAEDGAKDVECDVHFSKDGIPMVFQDDDLLRVTGLCPLNA